MKVRLLLLFTLVPLVELVVLLKLAEHIGAWYTILIIILTGILGVILARSQGLAVLRQFRYEFSEGRFPSRAISNGVAVLIGSAFLLTPGILTDAVGFTLLIPITRQFILQRVRHYVEHRWLWIDTYRR